MGQCFNLNVTYIDRYIYIYIYSIIIFIYMHEFYMVAFEDSCIFL